MDILQHIKVQRVSDGQLVEASIVRLSPDHAPKMIDEKWWDLPGISPEDINNEGDSHWKWGWIAGQYSAGSVKECVAILSEDNYIEGALAYQFNTRSALEPSEGTVYVGWLATAPRNRSWLVGSPVYRGIGTRLLYWAVRESYNAGLGGRISLESLPTPSTISFYEHKGFVRTDLSQPADDLVEYELPASAAQAWLKEEGDLQK